MDIGWAGAAHNIWAQAVARDCAATVLPVVVWERGDAEYGGTGWLDIV